MNFAQIFRRLTALEAARPVLLSFSQFAEEWEHMDSLSKSLYELSVNCPKLVEVNSTTKDHLRRLDVIATEPSTLDAILADLRSDDI